MFSRQQNSVSTSTKLTSTSNNFVAVNLKRQFRNKHLKQAGTVRLLSSTISNQRNIKLLLHVHI